MWQFTLRRLRAPALCAVLDLDSTVFERYGHQQRSLKGYNPRKHGRPSHHRLRCTVAGLRQWTPFATGLAAAETSYQAVGWKRLAV